MTSYSLRVIETRSYERIYEVDADTPNEAIRKAEVGDTVIEHDAQHYFSVIDRIVTSTPVVIPDED